MESQKITLTAIFLLAFEGYVVLAIATGECTSSITASKAGAASPPCQLVIPAVIKAVFQPEPAPYVPSAGNYAPALPPIIVEESNDNWQNLLYLIMLAKNNKRGSGGDKSYSGGCNSGSCGNNCGYNGGYSGGYNCGNGGYNGGWNCGYGNNCGGYNGGWNWGCGNNCGGYNGGWNCGCGNNCGGYNGGWNCGCGNNCGGFDGHSYTYPYQYNSGSGGYDHGCYPDEYCAPVNPSKEINLIIKTDSGTSCTCAK